jgi:MFS family permease
MAAKTLLMEYTPLRWMGMVTSLNESISQLGPGVGILLGGGLTAVFSPRLALGISAVATVIYAVVASFALRPSRLGDPPVRPRDPASDALPDAEEAIIPIGMESRETLA